MIQTLAQSQDDVGHILLLGEELLQTPCRLPQLYGENFSQLADFIQEKKNITLYLEFDGKL